MVQSAFHFLWINALQATNLLLKLKFKIVYVWLC